MGYIFGPVQSSRLGRSLGLDLIPYKICNFDCVYCECGPTRVKTNRRGHFVKLEKLFKEFDDYLSLHGEDHFDVVTLTGSGETTLELQLEDIIGGLRRKTNRPIALLTNGSLMGDPEIQRVLGLVDILLPSLDAVSLEVFEKVDQPFISINPSKLVWAMVDFRMRFPHVKFWLEILIVKSINDSPEELARLKEAVERIRPDQVHVGTVTRPPAYPGVQALSLERLKEIQDELLCNQGTEGRVKAQTEGHSKVLNQEENTEDTIILETLKRRPSSFKDLLAISPWGEARLREMLERWIEEEVVQLFKYRGQDFYVFTPCRSGERKGLKTN